MPRRLAWVGVAWLRHSPCSKARIVPRSPTAQARPLASPAISNKGAFSGLLSYIPVSGFTTPPRAGRIGAAVEVQDAAFVSNHHNMVTVGPARPKHGAFGRSDVGDTSPGSAMWSGRVARLRKVAK